jgi:Activator of Hsp90 ATPase homolog 1-like protein
VGRHRDAIQNDGGEYPVIVTFTRCHSTFDAGPNSFAFAAEGQVDETNGSLMIDPLRLSFDIRAPADHAFEVWTTRLSSWWPKGHSASGNPDTVVALEPRPGGRIFERTPDGTEIEWGEITLWQPPHRLGYLWHINRARSDATDVELTFVDLGDGTTRLDIVHAGWERLGSEGEAWREANFSGWAALRHSFLPAAEA